MTMRLALIAAVATLGPVSAYAQAAGGEAAPGAKPSAESCSARKFETIVNFVVDGTPRRSRVRICGKEGQSDSDWIRTLKDSVEKAASSTTLQADVKSQIITALNAEIADLEAATRQGALANIIAIPPQAQTQPRPPVAAPRSPYAPPQYSSLPPMPAPKPAATAGAAGVTAALPPLPRPKMTIRCLTPGQIGAEGPCDTFERDTLVSVRADENLASGTSLRFLRRGDRRAEIELAQLRKGQSIRFRLPSEVCAGVVGSQINLEVVRRRPTDAVGRPVDTLGPYELRC